MKGTLSNYLGAECMKKKDYSEAFIYFEEGAEMDNTSAIFNLGICHEMGWGTTQDLKKVCSMFHLINVSLEIYFSTFFY